MMQRYGRKTIILQAKGLHPDTSDILPQHEDWGCHDGVAHWQIDPHMAMVSDIFPQNEDREWHEGAAHWERDPHEAKDS